MRHLKPPYTPHTLIISLSSLALLALSIALIVLEERLQHAFRNERIQYPGSSIVEWMFITLNPPNLDAGPTVAKFAIGACSLGAGVIGLIWVVLHWCEARNVHIRMLGAASCIAAGANTAAAIGFVVYVFVTEAEGRVPRYFRQWQNTSFTQETYVCKVVPSVIADTRALYGFPACEYSRAAKYLMLGICCASVILAGVSVLQAHKDGVFAVFLKSKRRGHDVKSTLAMATHNNNLPRQPKTAHLVPNHALKNPRMMQNLQDYESGSRRSLRGYYAKS